MKCGEVLNQIKLQIKHGGYKGEEGWTKYVQKKCGIPYRTANRYCLIADRRDLWPEGENATVAHSLGVVKLEEHIKHQLKKPRTHSAKAHAKKKKGNRTGSDAIALDQCKSEVDAVMEKIEKLDEDDKKVVREYVREVFRFDEEDESSDSATSELKPTPTRSRKVEPISSDNMKDASAV